MTKEGLLSCAWTLRDSCSGEVESGDLLRKIVLERRARGDSVVEEEASKLSLREAQGQKVEVGEVIWSLCLPCSPGIVWGKRWELMQGETEAS